ncbi:acyl-CoA synthetase [Variovorax sp. Root411]|uniref:acyl-CoA synthetase n=1 Tax=Variovorax sp. Root411 TaxID=1736530 RepID=UPI0006F72E2A|nr:acyl-CoA synthetase [Variovorax sp. Root411]KQW63569.1 acyl-CoA synthetase [Variovorax sp. Root411]
MSHPPVANLASLLAQTAALFPDRAGLIQGERVWTWREIDARVDALVQGLRSLGVKAGDKVLMQSRNNAALFESCWAAFRLGAVWVPTNFRLTPPEIAYLGSSSEATVMLAEDCFGGHVDAVKEASSHLRHVVTIGQARSGEIGYESLVRANLGAPALEAEVEAGTPLWYFYTSGTTGRPKAAMLTHGQMAFVVANHLADLIPGTDENDRSIAVAPLSHGAGIHALLNVARGAATVLLPSEKLEPEVFWQLVEEHRVSNVFTVPTIVKMLVEDPAVDRYDHSSLRYVIYAGAPMYRADQKRALRKLGRVLVQYFGLGEVTGCITVLPPSMHASDDADPNANVGSCGRPRTGMQVAILDGQMQPVPPGTVGEICCRGPAVFAGYFNNPEATAKALRGGWFHTGDLGRVDARGLLYITGRESDMYISGGSNVYPREVEEVLLTHPGVAEVAVLGMPDEKWGEIGVAVVVASQPGLTAEALLGHLDGRCARYRWPRHFFFWDSLPKSGYGKITKNDIRTRLVERGELRPAMHG